MTRVDDQALALAGMFQAAVLVEALALRGVCQQKAFDCSLESLFTFDATSTLGVFGDLDSVEVGLTSLVEILGGESRSSSKNIAYYVLSMSKLARQAKDNQLISDRLYRGLQQIRSKSTDFALSPQSVIAQLDGLYQNNISPLSPRIIVRGEQNYLRNDDNAARIRTLLFAGIRAGVLWQQLGGSKWRLLLARKKYVGAARLMLARI